MIGKKLISLSFLTKVESSFLKAGTTSDSLSSLGNFQSLRTSSFQTVCKNIAQIFETSFRKLAEISRNVPLFHKSRLSIIFFIESVSISSKLNVEVLVVVLWYFCLYSQC